MKRILDSTCTCRSGHTHRFSHHPGSRLCSHIPAPSLPEPRGCASIHTSHPRRCSTSLDTNLLLPPRTCPKLVRVHLCPCTRHLHPPPLSAGTSAPSPLSPRPQRPQCIPARLHRPFPQAHAASGKHALTGPHHSNPCLNATPVFT